MHNAEQTEPLRVAVLGSGSGTNCQAILDAIAEGRLRARIVCVLTDVANATILQRAEQAGVPAQYVSAAPYKTKLDGTAEREYVRILQEHDTQVVALAGFMRILKNHLLETFQDRILNIHPSLLPAFPGLHSWEQALSYGTKVAGCTVHFVDRGTDTGPVIVQKAVPVLEDDTPESLHARIQEQEHIAYPEALQLIADGCVRIENRRAVVSPAVG